MHEWQFISGNTAYGTWQETASTLNDNESVLLQQFVGRWFR